MRCLLLSSIASDRFEQRSHDGLRVLCPKGHTIFFVFRDRDLGAASNRLSVDLKTFQDSLGAYLVISVSRISPSPFTSPRAGLTRETGALWKTSVMSSKLLLARDPIRQILCYNTLKNCKNEPPLCNARPAVVIISERHGRFLRMPPLTRSRHNQSRSHLILNGNAYLSNCGPSTD